MRDNGRLLFGPAAAIVFAAGVATLPFFIPGYDPLRQTVSEIGEIGSPMRWPFAALLWATALCLLVFALGVWSARREGRRGALDAAAVFCIAWMGVAAAALGYFAHPHPLHNVFGMSELIAYQAPLLFALAWRSEASARGAVAFSALMYLLTLASVIFNLVALADNGALWAAVGPVYGLVQRSLFACFFIWSAGVGWRLWARKAS